MSHAKTKSELIQLSVAEVALPISQCQSVGQNQLLEIVADISWLPWKIVFSS